MNSFDGSVERSSDATTGGRGRQAKVPSELIVGAAEEAPLSCQTSLGEKNDGSIQGGRSPHHLFITERNTVDVLCED